MLQRAYTTFEVKTVDEDKRLIEGVASSLATDRVGDVVEPRGVRFRKRPSGEPDVPIKFMHGRDPFVGDVGVGYMLSAKASDSNVSVKIQIAKTDQPGHLRDVLDYVWSAIKMQLVRGLSIGFRSIEDEPIKGTFGTRFKQWEFLEVSAVTIPANADASITSIKAIASETLGSQADRSPSRATPPVSGKSATHVTLTKPERGKMTVTEMISALEAKHAASVARMSEITEKVAAEGRTKTEEEKEEFDTANEELGKIKAELKDLRVMETLNVEKAKPVDPTPTVKSGSEARTTVLTVKGEEKLEPGISFARFAMALAAAKNDPDRALGLLQTHYPNHVQGLEVLKAASQSGRSVMKFIESLAEFRTKADVAAGTTAQATWAAPLVAYNQFGGDFVEYLRARTIIGQVQDRLRRIPFNVHIRGQTSGGAAGWVGQGAPKPVTKFDFNDTYHAWHKVAAIAVLTEELIRFSDPSAERLVRDALAAAVIEEIDTTFIDPAVAAVANVSPASITNGVSSPASSGDDFNAVLADLQTLWSAAIAANLETTGAFYVTTPSIALALSLMVTSLDNPAFPTMTMNGGTLRGIPVIVSNYVPAGHFILVFGSEIWFSDDGVVTIDTSREASIQMLDNPTNNSATPTATTMVSMYQTNSIAFRAERFITWSKRRSQAVAVIDSVGWGGAVES